MSEEPVAPKDAAWRSYNFLFVNRGAFCHRAAVPFACLVPVQIVEFLSNRGSISDPLGILLGLGLLAIACHVSFMVSWHRFLLLGEGVSGTGVWFGRREWRFLLLSLVPLALTGLIVIPLGLAAYPIYVSDILSDSALRGASFCFVIGVALWTYSRFLPAFPALAIDRPIGLRRAWQLTRNSQWTIVVAMLWSIGPATLLEMSLGLTAELASTGVGVALISLGTAIAFIGDAVAIGAASLIYAGLVPDPARPD